MSQIETVSAVVGTAALAYAALWWVVRAEMRRRRRDNIREQLDWRQGA